MQICIQSLGMFQSERRQVNKKITLQNSTNESIIHSRNCLRRIIHDDQEFSNQSIINVIERFVKTVNLMEETILIPSRLMDRQVKLLL